MGKFLNTRHHIEGTVLTETHLCNVYIAFYYFHDKSCTVSCMPPCTYHIVFYLNPYRPYKSLFEASPLRFVAES